MVSPRPPEAAVDMLPDSTASRTTPRGNAAHQCRYVVYHSKSVSAPSNHRVLSGGVHSIGFDSSTGGIQSAECNRCMYTNTGSVRKRLTSESRTLVFSLPTRHDTRFNTLTVAGHKVHN